MPRDLSEPIAAFEQMLALVKYPVDRDGIVHDLNCIGPTVEAILWTLAMAGARLTAEPLIKPQPVVGVGVYEDAQTWVDARASAEPLVVTEQPEMPEWHTVATVSTED